MATASSAAATNAIRAIVLLTMRPIVAPIARVSLIRIKPRAYSTLSAKERSMAMEGAFTYRTLDDVVVVRLDLNVPITAGTVGVEALRATERS